MKYLEVGKIVSTHGIKGEVRVKSDTSFSDERFKINNTLFLKKDGKYLKIKINSYRQHKGFDMITFNDYNNINDVLEFVNCSLYIDKDNLEKLDDGSFYFDDLIGLDTYTDTLELIGPIVDIMEVPQGQILIIKKNDKEVLVPFVDEFIKEVDIENKKVVITPIEGLL